MIRADLSSAALPPPPRVPSWALPGGPVEHKTDAAFFAGAALNSLDFLVRSEPVWGGAWRQRLALKCAAGAVRLAGRSEDEAALRDAWYLRPADGDAGPAGNLFGAWRQLASRPAVIDTERLAEMVDLLGLRWDDGFADLPEAIDDLACSGRPAPFAAAAIAIRLVTVSPAAELLAWWCADLLLAQKLRWPKPVPLLMAQVYAPASRTGDSRGKRFRPGRDGFERAVCLAVVQASDDALRLAADLSRRAERLVAVVPKLRAKGARDVIKKLLDDDAVPGSLTTRSLSRFETLLNIGPDISPRAALGDKGYSSKANRVAARTRGIAPVIPYKTNEKNTPAFFARTLYKARARVEQGFGRLKRFKRVALRCEKTAQNFRSIVSFAAGLCLIKFVHTT